MKYNLTQKDKNKIRASHLSLICTLEASRILGLTQGYVIKLFHMGHLKGYQPFGRYQGIQIDLESVLSYMEKK